MDSKLLTIAVAVVSEVVSEEGTKPVDVAAADAVLAFTAAVASDKPNVAPPSAEGLPKLDDMTPVQDVPRVPLPVTKCAAVMPPPVSLLDGFVKTCKVEADPLELPELCPVDLPEVETDMVSRAMLAVERTFIFHVSS